jgi:hypothetical protein
MNKDKFVAFSVSVDGATGPQYKGYLGITHRRLSGSTWYNGQFYADSIVINSSNGSIGGSDGAAPASYIGAYCSHGNNCFGPWSEMEMDGKDSYNWQRSYQTEDGWAFEIMEPPSDSGDNSGNGLNSGGSPFGNCGGGIAGLNGC